MNTKFFYLIFRLTIVCATIALNSPAIAAQNPQPVNNAAAFKINTVTGVAGANNGEGLRLNFRGASLDEVLDYLSRAAGFTIIKNANVDGQLDVWSHQPLNKDEAVDLLNTVLNEKGFAAVRNERVLTIVTREEAKKRNIPVKKGNEPAAIPKTDEMVTQIIPVRFANAVKLIDNLSPLLASYATMTADESSNAIVLTDTQANIRRIAEIIRALDSSISGVSSIKVFPLKFADASELAQVVNDLFQNDESGSTASSRNRQRGGNRFQMMFGGPPGMQQQTPEGGDSEARQAAFRITAAADEQTNSLIVSAPEEVMPTIEHLVEQVDAAKEELTEIRVFRLQNADAEEMAQLITDLFQDQTTSNQTQQRGLFGGRRFAMPGMPGMPGGPGGPSQQNQSDSERKLAQETVTAVADIRTKSVVVSASKDLMLQIEQMIKQLDANPSKTQRVYIYTLKNADVDYVADVLSGMFQEQSLGTSRTSSTSRTSATGRNSSTSNSSSSSRNSSNSGFGGDSSSMGSSR
ncbi:MAG: secretin N-terminal domain-containing protein [Candidatus Omnitrophota bacterium]